MTADFPQAESTPTLDGEQFVKLLISMSARAAREARESRLCIPSASPQECRDDLEAGAKRDDEHAAQLRALANALPSLLSAQEDAGRPSEDSSLLDWMTDLHLGVEAFTMDDQHGAPTRKQWIVGGAQLNFARYDLREAIRDYRDSLTTRTASRSVSETTEVNNG